MKKLFFLLAVFAIALYAADVTGRWTGTIDVHDTASGSIVTTPVQIQFEQKGDSLSGKVGRAEDRDTVDIKNGRIDGDRVTFEASSVETAGPMKFSLKLTGGKLEGDMKGSIEEGVISGHVKLEKAGK